MIIKGNARGRAKQLARHLLNDAENETVSLHEVRGVVSRDIEHALLEMETQARRGRSTRALYHASISPEPGQAMTAAEINIAVNVLEQKLNFLNQPRVVVTHKKNGREHFHVVWSRIDRSGRTISDSWNYAAHEEAARELEERFGHRRVEGAHTDVRHRRGRHSRKEFELRQEQRSGIPQDRVETELKAAWSVSNGGEEFRGLIENMGYRLARGDRRGFVVLDTAGEAHSLSRMLGLRPAMLKAAMTGVCLNSLPAIKTSRTAIRSKKGARGQISGTRVTYFSMSAGRATRFIPSRWRTYRRENSAELDAILAEFERKIAAACSSRELDTAACIVRLEEEKAAAVAAFKDRRGAQRSSRRAESLKADFRAAAWHIARPKTFKLPNFVARSC